MKERAAIVERALEILLQRQDEVIDTVVARPARREPMP